MTVLGHVRNGTIVLDQPLKAPEGTVVRVEVLTPSQSGKIPLQPRQGGQWKGRVVIAPDFDLLPDDIQEAFGMRDS